MQSNWKQNSLHLSSAERKQCDDALPLRETICSQTESKTVFTLTMQSESNVMMFYILEKLYAVKLKAKQSFLYIANRKQCDSVLLIRVTICSQTESKTVFSFTVQNKSKIVFTLTMQSESDLKLFTNYKVFKLSLFMVKQVNQ